MRIRTRIILGFALVFSIGFSIVGDFIIRDIRPRYLEAIEESLNDTANILASLVESEIEDKALQLDALEKTFSKVYKRKLDAKIYGFKKTGVKLNVYVTDGKGMVLYDSNDGWNEGKDFSRWNDVYLTLRGKYGARSTREESDDPASSMLHVAAPVRSGGKIIGVVTVVKPMDSITVFIQLAKNRVLFSGAVFAAAFMVLSIIISAWISSPVMRLTGYINSLKERKNARFPLLSGREMKELGDAFRGLLAELEGKKYIENYIQTLTHELKSPLSSIRGAAELLMEDDMKREHIHRFCGNILKESKRIDSIIEKLLLLSSLESRKQLEDVEDIPLFELMEEVIESLSPQAGLKGITIENSVNRRPLIKGERFLLRHALLNLLQNSINFSNEGGRIRVSSKSDDSTLIIRIADNGKGIPEYAVNRIFDRFYSLPQGETGNRGTGLGLSFVREAVKLHGGAVSVANNDQGGVTAELVLPAG